MNKTNKLKSAIYWGTPELFELITKTAARHGISRSELVRGAALFVIQHGKIEEIAQRIRAEKNGQP